jgi:phosphoglycerate dehydrogenase-like enzyme
LLVHERVVLTPHSAWLSHNSWDACIRHGYRNIERFAAGEPLLNLVSSQK